MFRAELSARTEKGRLVRSAGMAAAIRVYSLCIAFIASQIYARTLGPGGYGQLSYVLAWVAMLTIPASLGLPGYLIREGAKRAHALLPVLRWADARAVWSGVLVALALLVLGLAPQAIDASLLFLIAAPLPFLNNLSDIRRSILKAQGLVVRSLWPSMMLAPTFVCASAICWWALSGDLDPVDVLIATLGGALLTLAINAFQTTRHTPRGAAADGDMNLRLKASLPFIFIGVLSTINTRMDIIMLGMLRGDQEVGVYSVASRVADLIPLFMLAANQVLGPRVAALYHQEEFSLLQRLLTASARRVVIVTLPLALIVLFGASVLLQLAFGAAYVTAALSLQILVGAQLVNVIAGPTRLLLNMTGHEKLTLIGVGSSAALNIPLNLTLIPRFGAEGAAIATAFSLLFWNVLLWYWVRSRLRLTATAFKL